MDGTTPMMFGPTTAELEAQARARHPEKECQLLPAARRVLHVHRQQAAMVIREHGLLEENRGSLVADAVEVLGPSRMIDGAVVGGLLPVTGTRFYIETDAPLLLVGHVVSTGLRGC